MAGELRINPNRAHATPLTDAADRKQISSMITEVLNHLSNRGESLLDNCKELAPAIFKKTTRIHMQVCEEHDTDKLHEYLKSHYEKAIRRRIPKLWLV